MNKLTLFGCNLCSETRKNCTSSVIQTRNLFVSPRNNVKKENAKILRRFNEENKLLFGSLIETLPQKRKREERGINLEDISSNNGNLSEINWWRTTQGKATFYKKSQLQTGIFSVSQLNVESLEAKDDPGNKCDVSESVVDNHNCTGSKCNISDRRESTVVIDKSKIKLPQILVKNLTSFPLERKGKFPSKPKSSSILSIPLLGEMDKSRSKGIDYPSVSKVLNATMSEAARAALQKWKEGLIGELGEEGFLKYQKSLLNDGKMFHSTVQNFLTGMPEEEISLDSAVEGCWHSLKSTLADIGSVQVLESHVVHEELLYHGVIDCVAEYRKKLLLIEWKKSNKQKSGIWSTYDAPLQVAAYLGAMNYDKNYDIKVKGGLIAVAYTDGSPAHIHPMDSSLCQKYWLMWLKRLQMFWELTYKQEDQDDLQDKIVS